MADQTPPNDPLGDRLRATFTAERDDLERRHLAGGATPARSRSFKWIPFAIAATMIAIAGFAFAANRSDDQAVELDVAAQPTEVSPTPDPLASVSPTPDPAAPSNTPSPVADDGPEPPDPFVGDPALEIPYISGENMCGSTYNPNRAVVQTGQPFAAPALAEPAIGSAVVPNRTIQTGTRVELAGGCTSANNGLRRIEFYEIAGQNPGDTEWIRSDFLLDSPVEAFAPSGRNECGSPVPTFPHLVWGIEPDDPDGGLVAHTVAGIDAPVTMVIPPNSVVVPTHGCVDTENGSTWYEVFGHGGLGWVNARFLKLAQPACLVGGTYGTLSKDGDDLASETFFHTIVEFDLLGSIAERYNTTVDAIIRANPDKNPDLIIAGSSWRIPGAVREPELVTGPRDGLAVADGDLTAFAASGGSPYRWFPRQNIQTGTECFSTEQARQALCITGKLELLVPGLFTPIWEGMGPMTAWSTGRSTAAATQGVTSSELLEINVMSLDGESLVGFFDPTQTDFDVGHCVLTGSDSLTDQACTRVAGADRTAGLGTDEASRTWSAGNPDSTADHVHDIRTEFNDDCVRIVVEFGDSANTDNETESATLPPVMVDQQLGLVKISADGWQWQSSFDDPTRIDYDGGIGLFSLSFNYEFAVELMHGSYEPHVRFLNNPARVVVDLFPTDRGSGDAARPFGEKFVLRQPIQTDLTGQGIPVDNDIWVAGFGRPFEAAGLYRIWAVAEDVDAKAFLADPPEPLIEEFFATSGSADGWGRFDVPLPDLEPGSYIAVFGELPPTDEIGFYGTGQLFRVADSPTEEPGSWPEAVLLPDVQLPPE